MPKQVAGLSVSGDRLVWYLVCPPGSSAARYIDRAGGWMDG